MPKIANIFVLLMTITISILGIAQIETEHRYLKKEQIKQRNAKIITPAYVQELTPKGLVRYNTNEMLIGTFYNHVFTPVYASCFVTPRLKRILDDIKKDMNIKVRDCYRSKEQNDLILSKLKTNEFGKLKQLREYNSVDRTNGDVVDLEVLDEWGNEKYKHNKYLNLRKFSNEKSFRKYGLTKVTKYPWIWKVDYN